MGRYSLNKHHRPVVGELVHLWYGLSMDDEVTADLVVNAGHHPGHDHLLNDFQHGWSCHRLSICRGLTRTCTMRIQLSVPVSVSGSCRSATDLSDLNHVVNQLSVPVGHVGDDVVAEHHGS